MWWIYRTDITVRNVNDKIRAHKSINTLGLVSKTWKMTNKKGTDKIARFREKWDAVGEDFVWAC